MYVGRTGSGKSLARMKAIVANYVRDLPCMDVSRMTVNERFIKLVQTEVGCDPTFEALLMMFQGNILSIPEEEFRATLEKYLKVLQGVLNE